MINYLAIDTSGNGLTVAVGGEKKAVSRLENCTLTHSVELMGEIENTLEKAGLNKENIDVFACSVGPGSFTGIRIGVSTVKAFGYALNKKVLAVTSFLSLAYNVEKGRKKLAVIVLPDGDLPEPCGQVQRLSRRIVLVDFEHHSFGIFRFRDFNRPFDKRSSDPLFAVVFFNRYKKQIRSFKHRRNADITYDFAVRFCRETEKVFV